MTDNQEISFTPELKAKWIEALRSGEYKQTTNTLCSSNGESFCCLGVLIDLMGTEWKTGVQLSIEQNKDDDLYLPDVMYPTKFSNYINDSNYVSNYILNPHTQFILSEMNDAGDTFEMIADYIEEYVDG